MSRENCENGSDQLPDRRIGDLLPPGQDLTTVRPDDPLERAISIMKDNDYSQLPVLSNGDEPEAIITWESIGERGRSAAILASWSAIAWITL